MGGVRTAAHPSRGMMAAMTISGVVAPAIGVW
jgi:hypothetical protein